jgi:hypothetical protein
MTDLPARNMLKKLKWNGNHLFFFAELALSSSLLWLFCWGVGCLGGGAETFTAVVLDFKVEFHRHAATG